MTTWEYLTTPLLIHNTAAILNNWGKQGWELVQVVPGPEGGLVAYLKRPVGGGAGRPTPGLDAAAQAAKQFEGDATMSVSARLAELGIELPAVVPPVAAYVPAKAHGDLVYTSGQLPMVVGRAPGDGQGRRRPRPRPRRRRQGVRPPVRAQRHRRRGGGRRRRRPPHRRREAHRVRRIRPRVHRPARRHQRRERGARRDLRRGRPARPLGGGRARAAARQPRRGRGRLLPRLARRADAGRPASVICCGPGRRSRSSRRCRRASWCRRPRGPPRHPAAGGA